MPAQAARPEASETPRDQSREASAGSGPQDMARPLAIARPSGARPPPAKAPPGGGRQDGGGTKHGERSEHRHCVQASGGPPRDTGPQRSLAVLGHQGGPGFRQDWYSRRAGCGEATRPGVGVGSKVVRRESSLDIQRRESGIDPPTDGPDIGGRGWPMAG